MKLKKVLVGILACLAVGALALGFVGCETDEAGNSTGNTGLPSTSVNGGGGTTPAPDDGEDTENGDKDGNETPAPDDGCAVVKQPSEGLEYTLSEDGTYYSVTDIGTCMDTEIVIPAEYKGLPVKSIDDSAFEGVVSLMNVYIPNSVTSIGYDAFYQCNRLVNITIPDCVTSIGEGAFSGCSRLRNITIPDSVTSIGSWAFEDCYFLTSIVIPDSVTSIGEGAFNDCSRLTSVVIGDSVTSIGEGAFHNTAYYNDVGNWENGVLYIGKYLIGANADFSGSYTVKEGMLCIAECAFLGRRSLTNIIIPNTVTSIGKHAFDSCTSLTSITFEGTVEEWTAIEKGAYWNIGTPATKVVCDGGEVVL